MQQLSNGTLERTADGRSVLHFERQLAHPVDKVWRAITDPAEMKHWFPSGVAGEFRRGAKLTFSFADNPTEMEGTISELEPPRLLAFSWGTDALRFELQPTPDGTTLIFDCTFIDDGVKAARDAAGWHVTFDSLAAHLDRKPAPWTPQDRWQQLYPGYLETIGGKPMTFEQAKQSGYDQLERAKEPRS